MSKYIKKDALEKAIRKRVYAIEVDDILAEIEHAPTIEPCEDAIRVYSFLKKEIGDTVDNEKEFEAWFERMVWHVRECDRLSNMVCEDAISREEAIKRFCEDCKHTDAPCEHEKTCQTMRVIQTLPSVVPSRPKGEWIAFSEKLPSEHEDFLVTDPNGNIRHCYMDKWGVATCEEGQHIKALRWMPMPEPWKGVDE